MSDNLINKKLLELFNIKKERKEDELNSFYNNHMYTSNAENEVVTETDNCQSAETEVKFWKDWLILHLDLIQQQNDELLNKERTILILQQENEMLKERLSCMERGIEPSKFYTMTQDSLVDEKDNKNCIQLCDNGDKHFTANHLSDGDSQTDVESKFDTQMTFRTNKIKTDIGMECDTYNVTSTADLEDSIKTIRMNIGRKRLSNSSTLSNADSIEEKRSCQNHRVNKKRKRVVKDSQILLTSKQYITEASEANSRMSNLLDPPVDISSYQNLEVPRWRVKLYASCYAMEGTENLDDEVFNKRHSRLETDERRRKRWDVQRIREQRVIDKLKQRQERVASKIEDQTYSVQSLWPKFEDIKYIEVGEQLPVSAFGCPIPHITPSEFSLPWLNNPGLAVKKSTKKSNVRRKNSKR